MTNQEAFVRATKITENNVVSGKVVHNILTVQYITVYNRGFCDSVEDFVDFEKVFDRVDR